MWGEKDEALQVPSAEQVFPPEELAKAREEWQRRLDACPEAQRPYLVLQYATPVRNQYQVRQQAPVA